MLLRAKGILSAAAAAVLLAAAAPFSLFRPPFPAPGEMKVAPEEAVEVVGFLSLGMRRVAADIAFLRLLQYYGTRDDEDPFDYLLGEDPHGHGGGHHHSHDSVTGYKELVERVERILDMDPYFEYAVLYGAGALAFNLERPDEAVRLLEKALARSPRHWKYQAYLAAIGYQKDASERQRVAETLLPVALDPESPALIKQVTAFLLKKMGRKADAARVYRLIIETSNDPGYVENARKNLATIGPL